MEHEQRIDASGRAKRYVIVGGVAGGASAAARLRRLDEDAEVVVIERGEHVSFANCGLPYHLSGAIAERDALLLQTPESLRTRFALDVRVRHEVVSVDSPQRLVTVADLESGELEQLAYDALVLSPGARPIRPPIPGAERGMTLRDLSDLDRLVAAASQASTAVVVGGGFVGLEVAENLAATGTAVTVVELAPQVLAPLDQDMVGPVHDELRLHGVGLALGRSVTEVRERTVVLDDGSELPAELVVFAIGVRPEIELAVLAGLEIGPRGGIVVDDDLRTSVDGIYAVGDATEKRCRVLGEPTLIPLANLANRQGRRVADVIAGRPGRFTESHGTAVVKVFGLTVATTGLNERRMRAAGRDVLCVYTHPGNHAGYFPGAETMHLKLVVDARDGSILGAQGIGREGVDKRIDVISTAISAGLRAPDLADLELAYAPMYGSAKDPVNQLGYVAENALAGEPALVAWHEIDRLSSEGWTVLDVRSAEEYGAGSVPGAINVPLDELRARLGEVPDGPVVTVCAVGQRGHAAASSLQRQGWTVANLSGGYATWISAMQSVPEPAI